MDLSLSAAARMTGKAKSTIHRAIKVGRLSAQRHDDGTYTIDAAELSRVFPEEVAATVRQDALEPPRTPPERDPLLAQEVTFLRDALERERETVADLRTRLTRAEERLTHQPPPAPRAGLLARLLGR